jgi:rhodanese-related sulfurtransferase
MKMIEMITLVFILGLFLASCNINNNEASDSVSEPDNTVNDGFSIEKSAEAVYHKISAEEAREIMESTNGFIVLDVRTEDEYREKRIDGAILIPDHEIQERAESELPDKNAVILVYCRSGRRSANAAKELADMGYTNVYDFGGILDWTYDTVSG